MDIVNQIYQACIGLLWSNRSFMWQGVMGGIILFGGMIAWVVVTTSIYHLPVN